MHVRTPIGKKIICINKVLLWELGRVHVGKVIKLKKKQNKNNQPWYVRPS